jgi:hypothetical protein
MKKKIFALLAVGAVLMSAAGVGLAGSKDVRKAKKTSQLATLLPPSEAVATIDAKRLFGEALPQILAANQPMLTEILSKFEEIKSRAGIDYKQFQQVAVGVSSIKASESGYEYEPLVLARGQFNAAGLMTAAKTAAAGKYREEKIGERTVYVFSAQDVIDQNKDRIANSKIAGYLGKFLSGLNKEMALTSYDNNTLVFGSLARVREMFEAKTRVSSEILALVARKPNAIVNFGAQVPTGLAQFLDLDEDDLGKSLASIRQLSGSLDVAGGNTVVAVAAGTTDAVQAKNLKDTIAGFQAFAGILKSSKREDQKIYGRMLENVKVTQTGSEVLLDLQVPQADINILIGEKK